MDPISFGVCVGVFVAGYATSKYVNSPVQKITTESAMSLNDEITNFDKSKLKKMRNVHKVQKKQSFIQKKKEELDSNPIFQAVKFRRENIN